MFARRETGVSGYQRAEEALKESLHASQVFLYEHTLASVLCPARVPGVEIGQKEYEKIRTWALVIVAMLFIAGELSGGWNDLSRVERSVMLPVRRLAASKN
jgi:hypothetical protein